MSTRRDIGVIYQRTEAGESLLRAGASALGQVARRILPMIDGRRRLADLPEAVRPGDLEAAITELQTQGLIRFTGRIEPISNEERKRQDAEDMALVARAKADLDGMFAREMGKAGEIWDARVRDSVNLLVLRRVLREGIDVAYFRAGYEAARNLVAAVRPLFKQHRAH